MVSTGDLAGFASGVDRGDLPDDVAEEAKRRLLDAVAVGIGAVGAESAAAVRKTVGALHETGRSRLWGTDWAAGPPDAAYHNATLVASGAGDAFLAPTASGPHACVPAVVAAGEATNATGPDVLAGLAVAYEVHGELSWNAPLDGLSPATHTALAAAAGAGRTMGFGPGRLRSALGIAASRLCLAVGDESPAVGEAMAARDAVYACSLAARGLVGPDAVGAAGGWQERFGRFEVDLDPGCERVTDAAVLLHAAHPYAQSALEATVALGSEEALDPADVESVRVETFEEAAAVIDPLAVATALVDRELYRPPSGRGDTTPIAAAVDVAVDGDLQARFDRGEAPARVTTKLRDGTHRERETRWFTGHPATPAGWGDVRGKFDALTADRYDEDTRAEVVETARGFEAESAAELTRLLE